MEGERDEMNIQIRELPEYIREFIRTVYNGNDELARDFFNEKECLMTATQIIKDLRIELNKSKKQADDWYKRYSEKVRKYER